MNGWTRLVILAVLVFAGLAAARKGFRVKIHRGHKRGDRNFATRPLQEVGNRMRNYKRGVNKTFPFEQGVGYYFQYDIMLKPETENNAIPLGYDNRWPGAVIPYEIAKSFTKAESDMIVKTLRHIESLTCMRYVPRTAQHKVFLTIDNTATGCWSYVGRSLNNDYNHVNLQRPGCMTTGTIAHELMHAIGFYHEFTRPDRDNYVRIDTTALAKEYQTETFYDANFKKMEYNSVELYNIPYAYDSVMHYSKYAGAANYNKPIMINTRPWDRDFGNEVGLSAVDALAINTMNCPKQG